MLAVGTTHTYYMTTKDLLGTYAMQAHVAQS